MPAHGGVLRYGDHDSTGQKNVAGSAHVISGLSGHGATARGEANAVAVEFDMNGCPDAAVSALLFGSLNLSYPGLEAVSASTCMHPCAA